MIDELIEISKGFQSSVNIGYDFNDKKKLDSFLPTDACLEIVEDILLSTEDDSTARARILTGAYGRGKSYCVMIALSILFNSDTKLFSKLIDKIKKNNILFAAIVQSYIKGKKRILPVIINGNSGNMSQAFLGALQHSLHVNGLDDIKPETHFQKAINTIRTWQSDYPDTYAGLADRLTNSIEEFLKDLSANSVEAYHTFLDIYPILTAGSVFNPFVSENVIDIYDQVNTELKKNDYSGIFVVYDEFGKYLESNITTATDSETKMLQDFAEKCNRPSAQQLHLLLVCHKDISNYIDMNLPQDKVDGWRGISGRFEHITLSNHFSQNYELISHVIRKKAKKWVNFRQEHAPVFDSLYHIYHDSPLFGNQLAMVIEECYPLHPVTTFILPHLSERVAQNERTLFTFLSSNQKNTLMQFVANCEDDVPFVTPDYLYDYFEAELRRELNSSDIHTIYALSSKILRHFSSDSLSAKIIKCIAVIHCIQQFELLSPFPDTICDIYGAIYDTKEVSECIQNLIGEKYILYRKLNNNFLCLKKTSGVNIHEEIEKRTAVILGKKTEQEIMDSCMNVRYLYPTSYNDDTCITRYFTISFVTLAGYLEEIAKPMDYEIAGRVFAVFHTGQADCEEFRHHLIENLSKEDRHVTIVSSQGMDITAHLAKYLAIKELRDEAIEDNILFEEYSLYLDDYHDIVNGLMLSYVSPELAKAEYYHRGQLQSIHRKSQLSELLSKICRAIYVGTPIINNESLNKDRLAGVAINSRARLLTALLANDEILENLGLKGSGQDVSFMRSTLVQKGILCANDMGFYLNLSPEDEKLAHVLGVIKHFFMSTIDSGRKSFAELYDILRNPEHGIGMKKGVIPIYIAVALHEIRQDLIFLQNGTEARLSADLLNAINEKPELYAVVMEDWNPQKSKYIQRLGEVFTNYIHEHEKNTNRFLDLSNAIGKWYLSLPKCSREMTAMYSTGESLDKASLAFLKSLKKQTGNAREYLMDTLVRMYGNNPSIELAEQIATSKSIFDRGNDDLQHYVIQTLIASFSGICEISLFSAMTEWYAKLKVETTQHLFANNENTILHLISTITNDEITFAEQMAKTITGLRLNDWNHATAQKFAAQLSSFKTTVEEYDVNAENIQGTATQQFTMTMTDENGVERKRSFERVERSKRANLLYQDITAAINEMGQAITEQEKRQVLIDILSQLCK